MASFWITNPDNVYRDNVAAGSDANGFWMSLPEHPNGKFEGTEISRNTWPRNMRLREFKGNVAHSNYDGFMFDRNIAANNTFGVTGNMHISRENPADSRSPIVEQVFEDLTAYKNRNGGFWGRGEVRTIRNYKSADNAIGYTQASGLGGGASVGDPYTSRVVDSLFVGETENIGNPRTDAEKAAGRSLPKPEMPDFPVRGYEYYDARHDVVNVTFRNFEDNATRKTGALSYLHVHQLRGQLQQHHREGEIRERQAGVFPADGAQVGQRQRKQSGLEDRGDPRQGRLARRWSQCLHSHPRRRQRQHRHRHTGL